MTLAAMSGKRTLHEWRVRTSSCLYLSVSSCSVTLFVLITSFFKTITNWEAGKKKIQHCSFFIHLFFNTAPGIGPNWPPRHSEMKQGPAPAAKSSFWPQGQACWEHAGCPSQGPKEKKKKTSQAGRTNCGAVKCISVIAFCQCKSQQWLISQISGCNYLIRDHAFWRVQEKQKRIERTHRQQDEEVSRLVHWHSRCIDQLISLFGENMPLSHFQWLMTCNTRKCLINLLQLQTNWLNILCFLPAFSFIQSYYKILGQTKDCKNAIQFPPCSALSICSRNWGRGFDHPKSPQRSPKVRHCSPTRGNGSNAEQILQLSKIRQSLGL